MDAIIICTIVFLYGIVIGSFLNVCIYRIPEGTSIVTGRSHCTNCNNPIQWYDLIPIFSYIFLLGRCRKCKSKISIQYPMIEALNGLLYVLVFYLYGFDSLPNILLSSVYCFVVSALIVLSVIDFRTNIIPIGINIFIIVMGIAVVLIKYFYINNSIEVIMNHLIGMLVISVFLFLILLLSGGRAMGGGDVKLMGAAGLVLGWQLIILAFMLGCVLAAIIHPIRMKLSKADRVLAFGPYLAVGICIALLYGNEMIDWYIQSFFI